MFSFDNFGRVRLELTNLIVDKSIENLNKLNIVIVGGTGGIGKAIANAAVNKGANVTVVGRIFRENPLTSKIKFIQADLSCMRTALAIAKQLDIEKLETIIFTQGIFAGKEHKVTEEGIELDMAISHLSRFVMLRHLAIRFENKKLEKKPRIFVMGFPG
jgi:NAD(P)-dependent dehydrogenase (short-subunit alcohol dehydrogenase family)